MELLIRFSNQRDVSQHALHRWGNEAATEKEHGGRARNKNSPFHGMTFKVKSDTRKDLDDGARMIHFTLFNGERKWAIASQGDLKKTEDGYT